MATKKNGQVNDSRVTGNEIKTTGAAGNINTGKNITGERNYWINIVD